MQKNTELFEKYKVKQNKLSQLIKDSYAITNKLDMAQNQGMKEIQNKVDNDSFKIMVLGSFKNGKSTFINSFFGEDVLPAYATPCTAVISEVKYGAKNKAILYFKNPLPAVLSENIPKETMEYMKKYGMKNIPPLEIPYDEMEKYVVIPDDDLDKRQEEALATSPYQKAELYWPLDLLENGVEIIDSPGLNEDKSRTATTLEYLSKTDAILFMLNAQAACSQAEMEFIKIYLQSAGFEDIIFVINRLNQCRTDKDREKVKSFVNKKVSEYTSFGEKGIFPVSALDALEGRMNEDEKQFKESGMKDFEPFLADFLVNNRGKTKLRQPAKLLKSILNEATSVIIPNKLRMLDMGVDDLKKKYNEAKPKLYNLQTRKSQLKEKAQIRINSMMPDIKRCINSYYSDLNAKIPQWIDDYSPVADVKITHIQESVSDVTEEITQYLADVVAEEQEVWKNEVLNVLIEDKVQDLMQSLESPLEKFYIELDSFKVDMSGSGGVEVESVPVWQRVTAAGIGLFVGGAGAAVDGGINGLSKEFAKGLAIQVGAMVGLSLLGFLNPFTIIAVIGAGIFRAVVGGGSSLTKKVKDKMKTSILDEMAKTQYENIDEQVANIKAKISEISDKIISSLDNEINGAKQQVENTLKEMEKGQGNVDRQKAEIKEYESNIKKLESELDNFIFDLIG